ncbi:ribonuclease H-like domain-containing protein [Tanacetum coccineum]
MTNSTKDMIDLVDVSDLKLTVGHPNGTLANITHFGNLKLNNDDLKKGRVMGTGSEFDGLYLFDKECNKSAVSNNIWFSKFKLFDFVESEQKAKSSSSLYDDEEGPPARDDSVHHSDDGEILRLPETEEQIPSQVPTFQNVFENPTEEVSHGLRMSSRVSKLPVKLNEYVMDNKVKYGLNRYANHTFLSLENCCFVSNLNKTSEPSSFEEASKDPNWISAMNDEMMALYENDTWYLTDLPIGRKPIGSKWVYRIKYKFDGEVDRIVKFGSFCEGSPGYEPCVRVVEPQQGLVFPRPDVENSKIGRGAPVALETPSKCKHSRDF